ncbi:ATP-dependent RNA helicase RhlE [Nitzschia inconspicua]|uniref:RNA helicase n=1 Tax=Nitzschia inconspicua TaxID=303405 RepID=A0A9K3PJC4_9STRA|nr:ATP-dependent RNA helicase RhlE [Nitzschia inconspicua]
MATEESAEERKRKRLEAWRKRQQQSQNNSSAAPSVKVSLSLGLSAAKKLKKKEPSSRKPAIPLPSNPFGDVDDDENDDGDEDDDSVERGKKGKLSVGLGFHLLEEKREKPSYSSTTTGSISNETQQEQPRKRQRKGRWDAAPAPTPTIDAPMEVENLSSNGNENNGEAAVGDALDTFMDKLQAGALGSVTTQVSTEGTELLTIDVGGSMMRVTKLTKQQAAPLTISGGVITSEQIAKLTVASSSPTSSKEKLSKNKQANPEAFYTASDWESDNPSGTAAGGSASEAETEDDEEEERARRAFIEALKAVAGPDGADNGEEEIKKPSLAAEVKTEKDRREKMLRNLERQAEEARLLTEKLAAPEFGRLYNDAEGGVMDEAERNLEAAMAAPDALQVLAELNKKKELKSVDHSKIEYIPFKKNLYIVPRSLASLSNDEVLDLRAKMKVRVRGHGAPAPVSSFEQCGLSERVLKVMEKQGINKPFPVQAQCIPCIMAGRDTIGIAKTGSGKTLAFLLPLLRHIMAQPPLAPNESGPIGLILAPARELAYQIHVVCKTFAKSLGLKSAAVYGGASVAEQIGDLKRGAHIVVATPGRLIDILTMQSGKLISLQRVTYVVMDEADRMYDMGFSPQISAILSAVRPDRQTVLFSATFPKTVETLARKSLKYPLEVIVGGRSVASDNVIQYAELVEEDDKFLRLLQLLGEHVDETRKAIVFVDTQVRADNLFEQLLRSGYDSSSLHGGKEQEDRDSTIADFKRKDGPNVLVATGVAGRGLDVSSCSCVINYSCPNHLEAYVHQVGRTGRAGNKGTAYTMVNSTDEAKYAPNIVRALSEAGQSENISTELKALSDSFKEKVQKGEARYASSGFKGRGYTYDASEMNESQKVAQMEKRQALIEAGLLDPDDEEPGVDDAFDLDVPVTSAKIESGPSASSSSEAEKALDLQTKLTPELLALPGMKDAILRRAGIIKEGEDDPSLGNPVQMGSNHFLQEFEINDYPREARWKVTQKETTLRLQDEFQTAVTLKGEYFGPGRTPAEGERKLYLHLEAHSELVLKNAVVEIKRMLNEETLRVSAKTGSSAPSSHKYSVLGK